MTDATTTPEVVTTETPEVTPEATEGEEKEEVVPEAEVAAE